MNIKKVELRSFMSHEDSALELPNQGIVLVVGANGAGKSSFVEGVATAGWGKTLRGTEPWRDDVNGSVGLLFDEGKGIARRRVNGKSYVGLSHKPGTPEPEFETATKAQEAIEKVIGTFDVWRRTRVFSSQDAAHFTLSTDSERKRLLESLLGIDKFDVALDACRADLRLAESNTNEVRVKVAALRERVAGWEREVRAAEDELALFGDPKDITQLKEKAAKLDATIRKLDTELEDQADRFTATVGKQAEAGAGVRTAQSNMDRFDRDECATCGQPIPPATRAEARAHLKREQDLLAEKVAHLTREREALIDERRELESEHRAFQAKHAEVMTQLREQQRLEGDRRRLSDKLERLRADQAKCSTAFDASIKMVAALERDVATLEAVARVLGYKGVRAHVLGRALGGIETIANQWLARVVKKGITLKLRSYTEKKTGGISDAIALDVVGCGGGRGYRASSGGERRRIDIALLLALAEVAEAAHGVAPTGTLWFDECLDALDADGREAVVGVLADLSKTRAVVVITHNPDLAARLPVTQRIEVRDGHVV